MAQDEFLDLLEDYLNEEEIEMKKRMDEEDPNVEKLHTNSPFTIDDTIQIGVFANEYLELEGDCSNLIHSSLKDLGCTYLVGVDNNFANTNPELVRNQYLLLVIDAHHNRGTYINPRCIKMFLNRKKLKKEYQPFTHAENVDLSRLGEYYERYMMYVRRVEMLESIYNFLREVHKVHRVKKIGEMKENDKH